MDILNDYYPLYPNNPNETTDSGESEENENYIRGLDSINSNRKRKKLLSSDDFCLKYSDDIWYIWCIIKDYSLNSNLLDRLDYASFCQLCYENSTKY